MRIGIDGRLLGGRFTGDRTYWRGLVGGLAEIDRENEYILYLRASLADGDALNLPPNFVTRIVHSDSDRLWSLMALPHAAKSDGIDVMHVQYTVSPLFAMPVVTTVHDISFRLFPDLFARKDRWMLNASIPAAIRRACRVIGVSENTRQDILRVYHPPEDKVIATPLAPGAAFRPLDEEAKAQARALLADQYGIDGPFVISVGVLQPRKNLPLLLDAFRAARRVFGFAHKLVITGKAGWLTKETDQALAAAKDDVILTDYVPDEHLPLLYACADLMCYPSLYEGFGLPPLEAMACDCPVMVSNSSSLPEVVGDAGILLPPTNIGAWIDSLGRILEDSEERRCLSAAGLVQCRKFDWTRTAKATLDVYRACHKVKI